MFTRPLVVLLAPVAVAPLRVPDSRLAFRPTHAVQHAG